MSACDHQWVKLAHSSRCQKCGEICQPVTSDGGSTSYYAVPSGATDLLDLIEHKKMSFGVGNIFKAAYRLGEKAGASRVYDLRKIVFFAQRELDRLEAQSTQQQ